MALAICRASSGLGVLFMVRVSLGIQFVPSARLRRSIIRQTKGVKISCMASSILPPGTTMVLARLMKLSVDHVQQVLEVDALGLGKADHHHALVGRGNVARDEGVGGVDHRHALEVDMRVHELRADVVHVVGHAAQDGVGHRLGAVAALGLVAPEFLDPLQVDDRHHADQQVGVPGDVDLGRDHGAVQAFVEQQVGAVGHVFPGREGARLLAVGRGLLGVVQVLAALAGAGFGVVAKQRLQLVEQVVLGAEVAEVLVARLLGLGALRFMSRRSWR